jgi:hypothetical protein
MKRPAQNVDRGLDGRRPASARTVAKAKERRRQKAKGKTTTKGKGNGKGKGKDKGKAKGNGKGEDEGNGKGKGNGKFDEAAAAFAAIRAEAQLDDEAATQVLVALFNSPDQRQSQLSNLETRMSPHAAVMFLREQDARDRNAYLD